nr:MFS transporter [Ornithinimicrobium sp. F0845]
MRTSAPFARLWAGTSLSAIGAQITTVAVLYQVWEMTHSPLWTGAIGLAHAIPMIVCGLWGGTLADTMDRRTLVRWTTTGQIVAVLGLAGQALAGVESLPLLLGLVAVVAGCGALGAPARRTFPTRLLPRDQVAAGIALQLMSFHVAMLVGPALGGLLIAEWGLAVCYLVDAVAVCAGLVGVLGLPPLPPLGDTGPARGLRAIADGLTLIRRRPVLHGSCLTDLIATVLAMPISLFPMINEIRFGGDPRTLGWFLSAVAVGGVTASLLSGYTTRARRLGAVQLGAATVWGVGLTGFGLAGPLWLALACLALAGAADTVSVTSRGATIQLATPDSHLGRVSSVEHVIGVAGPNLGNFRGGVVAGLTSAPVALASGGILCVVGVLAVAATNRPLRRFTLADGELVASGAGADGDR